MDFSVPGIVNVIIAVLNLLVNIFFCYLLASSPKKIKQPLKILLQILIFCSILFSGTILIRIIFDLRGDSMEMTVSLYFLYFCSMATSMSTSVWLSVFYCAQVVPARRALSVWIKKNIKSIIYVALIGERIWIFTHITLEILYSQVLFTLTFRNDTLFLEMEESYDPPGVAAFYVFLIWFVRAYFLLSIYVMFLANACLSRYLIGHIRHFSASSLSFSCPKIRGQLRAAVTGVIQSLMYAFCASWILYDIVISSMDLFMLLTVVNVYLLCTTLNLWAGQTVFRQRTLLLVRALRSSAGNGRAQDPGSTFDSSTSFSENRS